MCCPLDEIRIIEAKGSRWVVLELPTCSVGQSPRGAISVEVFISNGESQTDSRLFGQAKYFSGRRDFSGKATTVGFAPKVTLWSDFVVKLQI